MITTEKPPVGENIRRLRDTKGLRTVEVAVAAGTSQRNVQRWERGDVIPSWEAQVRLSRVFGVEPYVLWVTA